MSSFNKDMIDSPAIFMLGLAVFLICIVMLFGLNKQEEHMKTAYEEIGCEYINSVAGHNLYRCIVDSDTLYVTREGVAVK